MEEINFKLYINKAGESWITDRLRAEFYKENNNTTKRISNADIVWIISPWTWDKLNKKKLENLKTVCTIHHIDEAKVMCGNKITFLLRTPRDFQSGPS